MDAIQYILNNLPELVEAKDNNGKEFQFRLEIFKNHSYEMRLTYTLLKPIGEDTDMWENPYLENKNCNFLYLYEVVKTDTDLLKAAIECHNFLKKHKLINE